MGADGLIYRHVADKVMPDEDRDTAKIATVEVPVSKLALFAGLSSEISPYLG